MIGMGIHELSGKLDLARNEDAEDANVANPSEAANVAETSPTAQVSRAVIFYASPIRMTKKATKRTDVNKSSDEYTKDNSNQEDNEDNHLAEEEQNTKDSESIKTPPIKKCGRPKKLPGLMIINRHLLKDEGVQRKAMMNQKSKQLVLKENEENTKKKCLHETCFGSMIGMGIYELLGKLGFYVIDNSDTETNVFSLTDNSIIVTSQSVNDILEIPMGGCSLESLAPRSLDDPFIK
uniref:Uncharacterized protein n=1 Tax=Tanacetum cinerariifolium TaxID=118510 RepID=A0A6L2NY26_TANCI|nr:hypothetical protein [Tanacetum cinerariifolium]